LKEPETKAEEIRVHFRLPDGQVLTAVGRPGATVRDLAVDSGVPGILGDCGGNCACATCHVFIAEEWRPRIAKPEPEGLEDGMLECRDDRTPASRLSCQIPLSEEINGLVVDIPPG
jgi:ferredoxin, 2Fe-2S